MAPKPLDKTIDLLLVEDSPTQAILVKAVLDRIPGVNLLMIAEDGIDALECLRGDGKYQCAVRPDLVLLDINMPRKNGFEVLSEMKGDHKLKKIPVVVLTTSSAEVDVVKAYENGAATFISKPIQLDELQEILTHLVRYWGAAKLPRTK